MRSHAFEHAFQIALSARDGALAPTVDAPRWLSRRYDGSLRVAWTWRRTRP